MYGGVGRGKSFLMDCFFNAVPFESKTRLHFHEFMREVQHDLHKLSGSQDPLSVLGARIAERYGLICFDEFVVNDIADAMILYRLLDSLFSHHIGFVTTSNFAPDDLYPDGLQRERFLPAIDLLKDRLEVICVDNGVDYRRQVLEDTTIYHTPLGPEADAAMVKIFDSLAEKRDEDPILRIDSRDLPARRRAGSVVWFDFQELCGGLHSQDDYLEIASQFRTVLLSGVPQMPDNLTSEARRFIWLIDVLYDRCVKLILSAEVAPELLYVSGPLSTEFSRTVSRLSEMQSPEYLAAPRREVNTTLA
ncbi:Cell division protein ZapE OS=Castellaniella defragrans OX=75697 GN=HNR28_001139 PE=4 SV=1 [Castellaniella defragrans]